MRLTCLRTRKRKCTASCFALPSHHRQGWLLIAAKQLCGPRFLLTLYPPLPPCMNRCGPIPPALNRCDQGPTRKLPDSKKRRANERTSVHSPPFHPEHHDTCCQRLGRGNDGSYSRLCRLFFFRLGLCCISSHTESHIACASGFFRPAGNSVTPSFSLFI